MEDGRLTDGKGKTVDFRNTIIIATSNIGAKKILDHLSQKNDKNKDGKLIKFQEESKKKQTWQELQKELLEEMKKVFKPEFLNRVDDIIVFHALDKDQILRIVDLEIKKTSQLLRGQGIEMEITDQAKMKLADLGYDPQFGARPLRRVVQKEIENRLADKMLSGEFKSGDKIIVDIQKDSFTFST